MKILILVIVSFIFLTCSREWDNVLDDDSTEIPTEALVAHWPFNGNANDESGNGNNGIVNGAVLTTDRFDSVNSAFSFDGIDDYIDFGDKDEFRFGFGDFSICLWIYFNGEDQYTTIINKIRTLPDYNWHGFGITIGGDNFLMGKDIIEWILPDNPDQGVFGRSVFYEELTIGWHHIIMANSNSSSLLFYLDGVKIGESISNHDGYSYNYAGYNLYLATAMEDSYTNYKGKIDDVLIYKRILSEEEILSIYHQGGWNE